MSKIRNGSITAGQKLQTKDTEMTVSAAGVASRTEFWACNTTEFLTLCPKIGTAHPTYDQLVLQGPIKAREPGAGITYFSLFYEGFLPIGGDSSTPETQPPVYEWIGTENTQPITNFPRIGVEITEVESNGFSPFDGSGRWVGFPDGSEGTSGSDLFGIDSYIAPGGGIWRKTYISNSQPDLSSDGYIEEPDGEYPVVGTRNYRRRPTSFRSVGSKWEVVAEWEQSGDAGWAPEFYSPPPP